MAGAMSETYVVSEIVKSWWHRMQTPQLYYYRDRDGKEIDLLFVQDRKLHPLEVKMGATPKKDWIRQFPVLDTLKMPVGEGGVVCLCGECLPLGRDATAIPAGLL